MKRDLSTSDKDYLDMIPPDLRYIEEIRLRHSIKDSKEADSFLRIPIKRRLLVASNAISKAL